VAWSCGTPLASHRDKQSMGGRLSDSDANNAPSQRSMSHERESSSHGRLERTQSLEGQRRFGTFCNIFGSNVGRTLAQEFSRDHARRSAIDVTLARHMGETRVALFLACWCAARCLCGRQVLVFIDERRPASWLHVQCRRPFLHTSPCCGRPRRMALDHATSLAKLAEPSTRRSGGCFFLLRSSRHACARCHHPVLSRFATSSVMTLRHARWSEYTVSHRGAGRILRSASRSRPPAVVSQWPSLCSSASTARTSRSRKPRWRSAEKTLVCTSTAWGVAGWP
jgi:hypothetical protein